MATDSLQCSVITPEGEVYDGKVDAVTIPAHDGEIGILFHRAPLLCKLGAGRLRVRTGAEETSWFVDAGFCQVLDNKVTVLTQTALNPAELDRAEANRLLDDAREIKATDDVSTRRKAQLETSARARLRMAR